MLILTLNCGSSSLKFQLVRFDSQSQPHRIADGVWERRGTSGRFRLGAEVPIEEATESLGYEGATNRLIEVLQQRNLLNGLAAVGHRVVHGGDRFHEPTRIDDAVIEQLHELSELAPLHNQPALAAIQTARAILSVPMVAVFDTAFHRSIPDYASQYAIPHAWTARHRIRRYGFHGIAHRYLAQRYAEISSQPTSRLITFQLGNGCSAAAIRDGSSLDTSMGFTPLEGLMMGTRSGDLDPALLNYLVKHEGRTLEEIDRDLKSRSGLLGVSGRSHDLRILLDAAQQGDERARLAIEMFGYRVRKYLGAYLGVLNGADAILFGGGIGENSPEVRERILKEMSWCGLQLDPDANARTVGCEGAIHHLASKIGIYVIPVDEGAIVARETLECLTRES